MYKKGDLLKFNSHGIELFKYVTGSVGIISSEKSIIYESKCSSGGDPLRFYTYDILVCGTLFKNIPEEFLTRIVQNEKDVE